MVDTDSRTRLKQWLESGEARLHPLSFPQRELWENSPVAIDDCANHICAFLEIKGALTREEGHAAIQRVVDRHEVMRLSILPGKDRPLQMVRSSGTPAFAYRELSAAEARPEALEEAMQPVFRQPFDLLQGPLYRIDMMRRGPSDHILVFAIHHAIADGWSLGVFVEDLATAYVMGLAATHPARTSLPGRPDGLRPVPQTHSAWAAAERAFWSADELAKRTGFWSSQLAGSQPVWAGHDQTARGAGPLHRWVCALPPAPTRAIREVASRHGATLFSTLLAAFRLALWKWADCADLVVGTPVANRNREVVRQTMGYFAGIVPIRGQVDPARPFPDHLRTTHATAVDCFAHAMPFAEIARVMNASSSPGRHSLFDVRFALQNHPVPDIDLPRLSTRLQMRSTGTARFDLGCEITESGDELEVVWLYRQSMFSASDLAGLDRLFQDTVQRIGRNPDQRSDAIVP
jgi:hypothetical protein